MKTYMVTAQIKGRFCNGLASRGNLYDVNPTVGGPVNANSPEEAIEIYKNTKGGTYLNIKAIDYDSFFNPKAKDDCPF